MMCRASCLLHIKLLLIIAVGFTNHVFAQTQLESFVWQHRLVILNANEIQDIAPLAKQLKRTALEIRKLRIFALIIQQSYEVLPNTTLERTKPLDASLKELNLDANKGVLIGLDGGIKARFNLSELQIHNLNNLIDAMPMRRQELLKRRE